MRRKQIITGHLNTLAAALLPLLGLSVVFALVLGALMANGTVSMMRNSPTLMLALVVYFASLALLAKLGVTRLSALEGMSTSDLLTGYPNRRALHRHFASEAREDREAAIAMVQLDGFKQIHDLQSDALGDELLRRCARKINELCGQEALCYSLGGEEFAIVKHGALATTIVEGMCRALIDQLALPIQIGDRRIAIDVSVGLSRSGQGDMVDCTEMLRQASLAMDASRDAGRMRCTWYSPELDQHRDALHLLATELRQALVNEEFELHYQPLVNTDSGDVVAVEALMRWNRGERDPIGPNIFIPIAEESGLINTIGLWVLRQACNDAKAWEQINLSINISASQLRNPEFPIHLANILEETGFPPERLELEITETSLVMDLAVAERSLAVIRRFGVAIALDDFGTGYASIGFLRQFRFEKLKLDRSLVTSAETDEGSRAMMLSSVTVARAMHMLVTAEGVETQAQADMVRAAGCDQIQGWLYFRAMPASEIDALLSQPKNVTIAGTAAATLRDDATAELAINNHTKRLAGSGS